MHGRGLGSLLVDGTLVLLGDKGHVPHDPPVMSEKITIAVQP